MWSTREDGVVIGTLAAPGARYLRQEIVSLRRLVRMRQDAAPVSLPFGSEIAISVTTAPPEDDRLRALLAHFVGGNEPEWVWQWHEQELWCFLLACADATESSWTGSDDDSSARVELCNEQAREAFFQTTRAIAAVADHRITVEPESDLRQQLRTAHRWFWSLGDRLAALSNNAGQ
ncbi:MAG: hypothetical protein ACRDRN_18040 [Sciscionella sp.]